MLESIYWAVFEALEGKTGLLYFYIAIGYVFINCRRFGYIYSACIVVWLALMVIVLETSSDLYMTETQKGLAMLFGTLVGGWRYLLRFKNTSFGYPFFSLPNIFEKVENYSDRRRARRAYAEELGKEEARKQTRDSGAQQRHQYKQGKQTNNQRSYQSQSSKRSNSRSNKQNNSGKQKANSKSKSREENFRQARGESQNNSTSTESAWDILEISEGSTQDEIKSAYRRQASRFHPDKMPDTIRGDADLESAYNAKFIKVKEAFERLSNG